MLDIVGAITLAAIGVGVTGALVAGSPLDPRRATRVLVLAATWFIAVTALAGLGVFTRLGVPAVGVAVLAPIAVTLLGARPGSAIRTVAAGAPLALLVAVNGTRILGALFLVLESDGRLPATFAESAGWGDIAVGALAPLVAWMVSRRVWHWRPLTLAWNAVGLLDLVAAVMLGIGSAPDSPVRFIVEDATPGTLGTLPWILIPAFLVPLYVLTHLAVFARLAADRSPAHAGLIPDGRRH
jgi:hypothetical protein